MRFNTLTNGNYMMYALLHYDNPHCKDIKEFFSEKNEFRSGGSSTSPTGGILVDGLPPASSVIVPEENFF